MAPYHILIATISLYNKQFHRHFGLKKVLNSVHFRLDDIYFYLIFTPKTSLTGKICGGTISHINSHN